MEEIIETTPETVVVPPPAPEKPAKEARKEERQERKDRREDEDRDRDRGRSVKSSEFRALQRSEHRAIREIIESLNGHGAYRIEVKRLAPEEVEDPRLGRMVKVKGHLATLENEIISEDDILKRWGGGKYELIFKARGDNGSYGYVPGGHAVVEIAGDPLLTALPRLPQSQVQQAAQAPQQQEAPGVVSKAIEALASQNDRLFDRLDQNQKSPSAGSDNPAAMAAIEMLRAANDRLMTQVQSMQDAMMAAQQRPVTPATDPIKDRFLEKLIDQDSARIESVRAKYESEINQLREHGRQTETLLRAQFDRDIKDINSRHDQTMQLARASFELQIGTLKQSHELALASAKSAFDTQVKMLEGENKRLERDNSELRVELKELRSRKDKSLIEQVKDINAVKDALGLDEDSEPKGAFATLAEAIGNPETIAAVAQLFPKKEEPAAAQQQQIVHQPREEVFRDANGQYWKRGADGVIYPVKKAKKKKMKRPAAAAPAAPAEAAPADGQPAAEAPPQAPPTEEVDEDEDEDDLPEISEEDRNRLVALLENAVQRQQPDTVAQFLKSHMPQQAMLWLGDKCAEVGVAKAVNLFLTQIAKVDPSSPLMSQDGRNWVRALTRELLGDTSA